MPASGCSGRAGSTPRRHAWRRGIPVCTTRGHLRLTWPPSGLPSPFPHKPQTERESTCEYAPHRRACSSLPARPHNWPPNRAPHCRNDASPSVPHRDSTSIRSDGRSGLRHCPPAKPWDRIAKNLSGPRPIRRLRLRQIHNPAHGFPRKSLSTDGRHAYAYG